SVVARSLPLTPSGEAKMINFGPMIGAAVIPSLGIAPAIDLSVVLVPLACVAAGLVAVLLLGSGRQRRTSGAPARIARPTPPRRVPGGRDRSSRRPAGPSRARAPRARPPGAGAAVPGLRADDGRAWRARHRLRLGLRRAPSARLGAARAEHRGPVRQPGAARV